MRTRSRNDKSNSDKTVATVKPINDDKKYILYGISWTEIEVGWGFRSDGWSLHISQEEANKYLQEYRASLPKQRPDEYSEPDFDKCVMIEVSEDLYYSVKNMKNKRMWENNSSSFLTWTKKYD